MYIPRTDQINGARIKSTGNGALRESAEYSSIYGDVSDGFVDSAHGYWAMRKRRRIASLTQIQFRSEFRNAPTAPATSPTNRNWLSL